jgi:murein DD-endopeptidase MepM/ murein hydrolase activator NlpD
MAEPKSIAGEVEGDYGTVKVQLSGGAPGEAVARPTKGTQVVWGGSGPGSPWAHLAGLIEKAGGSVTYTFLHAADLKEPIALVSNEEDEGPVEEQKPAEAAGQAVEPVKHSSGGEEGHGPLFENGLDFQFAGNTARIWAHPHCFRAGPRPLIVALHGINAKAREKHPQLDEKKVHVGKLATKLIAEGKVTPLVIAAPTEFSDRPWGDFDLAKFVAAVDAAVEAVGVDIDREAVSVMGHSGAGGGSPHRGLNKLAEEGGKFDGQEIRIFGLADTVAINENAKVYFEGLKDNKKTVVYSLHKGTGGGYSYAGSQSFAKALGAPDKGKVMDPPENEADVDDAVYQNAAQTRISIRIKKERLATHHKEWQATGGYHDPVGQHFDVVPMWFWWALPRFFPAAAEDKQLGLKVHTQQDVGVDDPPEPSVTGGEWANVPPAAAPWNAPAADPASTGAALFAPASGLYWPVRNPKSHYGRAVCFKGSDGKGYGTSSGSHKREFLAGRPATAKDPDRYHAGIDVFGDYHDVIVACEAGTVVNFYPFYPKDHPLVWCLLVQGKSGTVINYGEVDPASLKKYGIKKGMTVAPGQPIAEVGRMVQDSMLHFETYPAGTTRNVSYKKKDGDNVLKSFLNPTQYLLALAKNGK